MNPAFDFVLQITQLIYNIAFIIFTFILVIYSIKTYDNQKKQPFKLLARINYSFNNEKDDASIVMLDIFNCGDYAAKMVKIQLTVNHETPNELDCINFIAPKENFGYYVGTRTKNQLTLFDGRSYDLPNSLDYTYINQSTNENIVTLSIHTIRNN